MEFIQPRKQTIWGWPALINFFLGGMAAGFYILSIFVTLLQSGVAGVAQPAAFKWIAPILAGLGLAVLSIEAGRPLRSIYLLKHLGRSWMSRETLAGLIFIPLAMLDALFSHPLLWGLAVIGAAAFMVSQGFILYRARAITAWNMSLMPLLFVTMGLAAGSGLWLLFLPLSEGPVLVPAIITFVCVALDLIVWTLYLRWSGGPDFQQVTKALRRPRSLAVTVGLGHLFPMVLLLWVMLPENLMTSGWQNGGIILAAVAIIAGGLAQKSGIVITVSYLRGIVLGDATGPIPDLAQTLPVVSAGAHQND